MITLINQIPIPIKTNVIITAKATKGPYNLAIFKKPSTKISILPAVEMPTRKPINPTSMSMPAALFALVLFILPSVLYSIFKIQKERLKAELAGGWLPPETGFI